MLRFEYDRVVGYHPYRTHQPWDQPGAVRVLQVDGVNCDGAQRGMIMEALRRLEEDLLLEAQAAGFERAVADNHYGFTVAVDRPHDPSLSPLSQGGTTFYQLRFSDGSLYVWLVPGPPREGASEMIPDTLEHDPHAVHAGGGRDRRL